MRAARVHHAARRRGGGVAARGARAAARADAAHRRAHDRRPRTIRNVRPASRRSCRGCSDAGLDRSAATCGSTIRWADGRCRPSSQTSRRNWSRSRRTSSWPLATSPRGAVAAGDPHRADRVRRSSSIRSAPASSTAWRGRAATSPASLSFEYSLSGKWLELLKEIAPRRDASGGPSGSGNSTAGSASSARSRPWRRRSGWR